MTTDRRKHTSLTIGEHIYNIGGWNSRGGLNSVERFTPNNTSGQWALQPAMQEKKFVKKLLVLVLVSCRSRFLRFLICEQRF